MSAIDSQIKQHQDPQYQIDGFFTACPICGRCDGYLNNGRDHWFVCHQHKIKWCVGRDLFNDGKEETEENWHANEEKIADYKVIDRKDARKVRPTPPPITVIPTSRVDRQRGSARWK